MLKTIKKLFWPITLASVIIAMPFFIFGILQSFQVTQGAAEGDLVTEDTGIVEEPEEREEEKGEGYSVITLGDSLARGTGDEENLGFAGRTVTKLEDLLDVPVNHNNYAVDGLRTSEMLELLNDQDFAEELVQAQLIMISIGGNDVRSIQGLPAGEREEAYREIEEGYREDLDEIILGIREENPQALVVFLGLYNLDYTGQTPEETELLLRWNAVTYQKIEGEGNFVWIPVYDLFQFQLGEMLSQDQLHPNGLGYEKIAERIIEVITPYFQ
jgi:lysophospholipase L1-like esterase